MSNRPLTENIGEKKLLRGPGISSMHAKKESLGPMFAGLARDPVIVCNFDELASPKNRGVDMQF